MTQQQEENWGASWQEANRQVRCALCQEEDAVFKFITCAQCPKYFHKTCVNPLTTDEEWANQQNQLLCDDCADTCMVCGQGDNEDDFMLACDNCDELWHWNCLAEDERCAEEDVGNEDHEWYCPMCMEEYGSDIEWAESGAIVADEDMQAEDCFSRSTCTCEVCTSMNQAVDTWDDFQPQNMVQQMIKNAIDAKEGLLNEIMDDLHFKHGLPAPR